ncbi:MAG TPA: hypothetical protein ENO12_01990 [Thermoplasmatales archaeon]|nr:hypothetical protein [Thermoplasmatales archaeon]
MAKDNAGLCTFDPNAPCSSCGNKGEIFCKPDENKVIVSHLLEGSFLVMAVLGTGTDQSAAWNLLAGAGVLYFLCVVFLGDSASYHV